MKSYDTNKKQLRDLMWKFELTDNLIVLALLVGSAKKILENENAIELLKKLERSNDLQKMQQESKNSLL
jgi:hypothetical protein